MTRLPLLVIRRGGATAAALVTISLALTACSGSGSASANDNGGSPAATTSRSAGSGSGGSASTASSSSLPFPVAVGNTWVYKSATILGSQTETDKMTAVTSVSGGQRVTMSSTIGSAAPTLAYYIFHSDGSITYPFSQFGDNVRVLKGSVEWPSAAALASGQTTSSTLEIAISQGPVKEHVSAHVTVKSGGTATVTVPAGSYSTTIVEMIEQFTVLGESGTITVKAWVAPGVGPVQSEASISIAGHSETVSHLKLVRFTRG